MRAQILLDRCGDMYEAVIDVGPEAKLSVLLSRAELFTFAERAYELLGDSAAAGNQPPRPAAVALPTRIGKHV